MKETPYDDISKDSPQDYLHKGVRAGFGAVPGIGAIATELLDLVIKPAVEKRRAAFFNDLANRLKELEKEDRITIKQLQDNPQFVDTMLYILSVSQRTTEEEKLEAFRNAILNTALQHAPEKAIAEIFLRALNTFTIWHIRILNLIQYPEAWFRKNNISFRPIMTTTLLRMFQAAYPELADNDVLVRIVWNDLEDEGFHRVVGFETNITTEGAMQKMTTDLADEFLAFINNPDTGQANLSSH